MSDRRAGLRLAAVLWAVAAVLALTAVAVRHSRGGTVQWTTAAAGLFCAVMAVSAWWRGNAAVADRTKGPEVPPPA